MTVLFKRRDQLTSAPRLAQDLMLALALKGMLLLAIYLFFFSLAHRVPSDARAISAALIGADEPKDFQ